MRVYEVFLKRDGKEEFRHAGSMEAADDELAVVLARENYARRAEGRAMWLVAREHVIEADEEFIAPNADKPHRHNDGTRVAARRRQARSASPPARHDTVSARAVEGLGPAERQVLLALADDEHLTGQRHTEWIGVAPFIEEDLAFASIGQDELGHAAMLYELLDDDADELALRRDPADYRSSWLAEAACTDWSDALIRHWLYDEAELLRWQELSTSTVGEVRAIAERALVEEVYHRRHAHALLDALATDADATARLRRSFTSLFPLAVAMFEPCAQQQEADCEVVGRTVPHLLPEWRAAVAPRFGDPVSVATLPPTGRTVRSPAFAEVYARMREVLMLDPSAHW